MGKAVIPSSNHNIVARMFGKMLPKKRKVKDPRYDYEYGHHEAAYQTTSHPFYSYVRANQMPTPGAMEYGQETQWLAFRPMIGPAIGALFQWRTIYDVKPIRQNEGLAAKTGLGGLAHGQIALQPLSDPYNNEPY